jgi:uncharacterized protein
LPSPLGDDCKTFESGLSLREFLLTLPMNPVLSKQLDEIVHRLVEHLKPERIILFGSHAYGEPNEDSDVDLLVIVADSTEPRHRRATKAYGALWGIKIPTDVVVLTSAEVERKINVVSSLESQAMRQGKVLYG